MTLAQVAYDFGVVYRAIMCDGFGLVVWGRGFWCGASAAKQTVHGESVVTAPDSMINPVIGTWRHGCAEGQIFWGETVRVEFASFDLLRISASFFGYDTFFAPGHKIIIQYL